MKQGYGVFGKAYEVMLRSDLHASGSIPSPGSLWEKARWKQSTICCA